MGLGDVVGGQGRADPIANSSRWKLQNFFVSTFLFISKPTRNHSHPTPCTIDHATSHHPHTRSSSNNLAWLPPPSHKLVVDTCTHPGRHSQTILHIENGNAPPKMSAHA
eukprot:scaffold37381_cov33-Tisochrysis_lutea.AAC.2